MKHAESGFTLIEVMVAIAIFAIVASVMVLANTSALANSRLIEEKLTGRWVNQNALNEIRIQHELPKPGETTKKVKYGGRDWEVLITVLAVDMELLGPHLRKITLEAQIEGQDVNSDVLSAVLGEVTP